MAFNINGINYKPYVGSTAIKEAYLGSTLVYLNEYLTVLEGDIYLDYDGNPVDVTVESNTDWDIEQV